MTNKTNYIHRTNKLIAVVLLALLVLLGITSCNIDSNNSRVGVILNLDKKIKTASFFADVDVDYKSYDFYVLTTSEVTDAYSSIGQTDYAKIENGSLKVYLSQGKWNFHVLCVEKNQSPEGTNIIEEKDYETYINLTPTVL